MVGWAIVIERSKTARQIIAGANSGHMAMLNMESGVWNEWEYVNPPLLLGVEYRTTERHLGKPVYRKAFAYMAPGTVTGDFTVAHGINNFGQLVECHVVIDKTIPLPYANGGFLTTIGKVSADSVRISNDNPYFDQNYTWYIEVACTKTTD